MNEPTNSGDKPALSSGKGPRMLNHVTYVTHDAAATADFYTRVLGMEFASTVMDDSIPSTGDEFPYFHIFFKMRDGSSIAFFECPGLPPAPPVSHPGHVIFNHLALEAGSIVEVDWWKSWLVKNGVDVIGPVDHKGMIYSIYFFDPNGVRLELTTAIDPNWNDHGEQAWSDLADWEACKRKAREEDRSLVSVLREHIGQVRKRYESPGN